MNNNICTVEGKPVHESGAARARILVVDDMATNRGLVKAVLGSNEFEIIEATSGEDALENIDTLQPDVILLDVVMQGIDGFDVCKSLRAQSDYRLLPIIMLTSMGNPDDVAYGMQAGASDYITKPFNAVELQARVCAAVEKKRLTDRLDDVEAVLFSLGRMVEAKDSSTRDHCDRLSHTAVVLGKALGLKHDDLESLERGGILHDIGKIATPDHILLKPGKLTPEEWEIMKEHPTVGAYLCDSLRSMRNTVNIIRHHHEKWDGSGYPDGLKGEEIPYLARIFQVVDVYDALSSSRPYKKTLEIAQVVAIMRQEGERNFWDPTILKVFLDIVENEPQKLDLPPENKEKNRQLEALKATSRERSKDK
ncbi:MAG: response regulator [Gammaproteobacteria bacterium]|nr:response regulator [Gammaproteobacteria bacterium]